MNNCEHKTVSCINPYELIRKYQCHSCRGVMMCACESQFALRFLKHQITSGTELHTQRPVPVTLGFQKEVCNTCRGLNEEAHPKAVTYGRKSKIVRYYWREIAFETICRFAGWAENQGHSDWLSAHSKHKDVHRSIEREVIEEIKKLHLRSPKYIYKEESQEQILSRNQVEVISLDGIYLKTIARGVQILNGDQLCSPEDFAARHFRSLGYTAIFTESIPFHTLFGIFMWILIQDPSDPEVRLVGFGDRAAFETTEEKKPIWIFLPSDFGTKGYSERRVAAIENHLASILSHQDDLLWLFDYWVEPSADFRQYLWAYRQEDVAKARAVVSVLPPEFIFKILRYLVAEYWQRYCGWPDILFYNQDSFFFAEVKASKDELSEDQKNWIRGNSIELNFPFKLIKIHKRGVVERH